MITVKKLTQNKLNSCLGLIKTEGENFNIFKKNGWSNMQIKLQLVKNTNYSLGIFENMHLVGFMLGDLISIEKNLEYEILLIYVKTKYQRKGLASKLLNYLEKKQLKLNKIYLEVSTNNINAIALYEKHCFSLMNIRKNYYLINGNKYDALCYAKKLI